MDARLTRAALMIIAACGSLGASYRTENFLVTAPTPELAREICEAAESYRRDLALDWLGEELPRWSEPCPITAQVSPQLGAGGATSFMFRGGHPFGWTMTIQGSRERLLDSVLPHEVTHTIFATHFGQPLPRWADEGACTTVEHASERAKQEHLLYQFLTSNRGIAFNQMFAMREYPADILPLYSQGYSLARYLIAQGGRRKFIAYVGEGLASNNWTSATQRHYGYRSLSELQTTWLGWVRQGMPNAEPAAGETRLAAHEPRSASAAVALNAAPGSALVPVPPEPAALSAAPHRGLAVNPVGVVTHNSDPATDAEGPNRPSANYGRTGGWYAKQRSEFGASVAALPGPGPDVSRQVTRPQPPEQPQQMILEWSRGGPSSAPPLPGPVPAPAYPIHAGLPSGGAVWR